MLHMALQYVIAELNKDFFTGTNKIRNQIGRPFITWKLIWNFVGIGVLRG